MVQRTEEEGFLRAIGADRDDDTPRLVFADWLDEHGQPERAEFIRVQCALARLPDGDPRRRPLAAREQALWPHRDPDPEGAVRRAGNIAWRRGFPDAVHSADPFSLSVNLAFLVEVAPTIHCLSLNVSGRRAPGQSLRADLGALAACEHLQRMDQLIASFGPQVSPAGCLPPLLQSPHLGNLRLLKVVVAPGCHGIGDAGVDALASAQLDALRQLALNGAGVSLRGAEVLAASPVVSRLTVLDLGDNPFGDAGAAALARSPHLRSLREINVHRCDLTSYGYRTLAGGLPNLTTLGGYEWEAGLFARLLIGRTLAARETTRGRTGGS
jgi:uncharacterized protein (TIGR02996 family)